MASARLLELGGEVGAAHGRREHAKGALRRRLVAVGRGGRAAIGQSDHVEALRRDGEEWARG
eukprot:1693311-Prymnesium_polylepis.1